MIKLSIQFNFILLWLILFLIIYMILNQIMHPISLLIMLIMFNLLSCLNLSMWKMNFIYSIMLFLIMISGLLIIFMYFSSLISNEQFFFKINLKLLTLYSMNLFMSLNYFFMNYLYLWNSFNYNYFDQNSLSLFSTNIFFNIINMYKYPFTNFTMLNIMFILFSFISIIKINSSSHSYSMRKIKYV